LKILALEEYLTVGHLVYSRRGHDRSPESIISDSFMSVINVLNLDHTRMWLLVAQKRYSKCLTIPLTHLPSIPDERNSAKRKSDREYGRGSLNPKEGTIHYNSDEP